jgi:hypothetical protein
VGEVYLAYPSLADDYHYQEQGIQQLIVNKPVNKLIFFGGQGVESFINQAFSLIVTPSG